MTPSNGTSSPPTKTVGSLAKGEGAVEVEVDVEELVGAAESRFPSALASVRCKGLMGLLLVMNLGAGLENGDDFAVMNLAEDNREGHFANMAPQGAWLSSDITNVCVDAQCSAVFCVLAALLSTQNDGFAKIASTCIAACLDDMLS